MRPLCAAHAVARTRVRWRVRRHPPPPPPGPLSLLATRSLSLLRAVLKALRIGNVHLQDRSTVGRRGPTFPHGVHPINYSRGARGPPPAPTRAHTHPRTRPAHTPTHDAAHACARPHTPTHAQRAPPTPNPSTTSLDAAPLGRRLGLVVVARVVARVARVVVDVVRVLGRRRRSDDLGGGCGAREHRER